MNVEPKLLLNGLEHCNPNRGNILEGQIGKSKSLMEKMEQHLAKV